MFFPDGIVARHTAGGTLGQGVYGSVARFFRRPRGLSPSTPSPTRESSWATKYICGDGPGAVLSRNTTGVLARRNMEEEADCCLLRL